MPHHALLDLETNAILTISKHASIIFFLRGCTPDTTHAFSLNTPNYAHSRIFSEPLFLARKKPEEYPKWSWNRSTRLLTPTNPDLLTETLIGRSALAVAKAGVVSTVMTQLMHARLPLRRGVEWQETVYMTKKIQAQRFKDADYDENIIMEIPYVLQYADFANLSFREAAEEILIKAKFDDELLAKTELLRLKYFQKIKLAKTLAELPDIREEFLRDSFITATL